MPFFIQKCPDDLRHYCPIRNDTGVRTQTTSVSDLVRFLHKLQKEYKTADRGRKTTITKQIAEIKKLIELHRTTLK